MAEINIEEMLKQITSNSELMEKISQISKNNDGDISDKLPNIISAISPIIEEEKNASANEKTDTPTNEIQENLQSSFSNFPFQIDKITNTISKNSKLLIALKPYLSKDRSDIVDSIVKMAQVADLMKQIKWGTYVY